MGRDLRAEMSVMNDGIAAVDTRVTELDIAMNERFQLVWLVSTIFSAVALMVAATGWMITHLQ